MKHYYAWNGKSIICNDYPNKKDMMNEISKIIDSTCAYNFFIVVTEKPLNLKQLEDARPK